MQERKSQSYVLERMKKYCAYQERCHQEVIQKLISFGYYYSYADEIVLALIQDGFLNEERFTRAYTRGKFRIKKWGKIKIKLSLRQKNISERLIEKALNEEIDPIEYQKALRLLIEKKRESLGDANTFDRRDKIIKYLLAKGYEFSDIEQVLANS